MSALFSAILVARVLLMGASATAEPRVPDCSESSVHFELTADSSHEPAEVCISPDQPLLFHFDTLLLPGGPELRGRERFEDVEIGTRSFTLIPRADLQPGERFEMKVRFADGAAPTNVTFTLVVHPVLGAWRVNVFRHARTVEDYQRDHQLEQQKSQSLEDELERMRAESGPGGLTGLFASGLLQVDEDSQGVRVMSLTRQVAGSPSNALGIREVMSCRTLTTRWERKQRVVRLAVVIQVNNPSPQPWKIQGAAFLSKRREPIRVKVWQSVPLAPDSSEAGLIAVELEITEAQARGPFTLKAWDESGKRLVTLGNVTFP